MMKSLLFSLLFVCFLTVTKAQTYLHIDGDGIYATTDQNLSNSTFISYQHLRLRSTKVLSSVDMKTVISQVQQKTGSLKGKSVVLILPTYYTNEQQRTFQEIVLSNFGVAKVAAVSDAVCLVQSTGKTTGLAVLATSEGVRTVPVSNAQIMSKAIGANQAGSMAIETIFQEVAKQTYSKEIVRDIKEKLAYVAEDFDDEMEKLAETNPTTTNIEGQVITIGAERFRAPEVLFAPNSGGTKSGQDGIHKLTYESIMKCDVDIRKSLYTNVVLGGINTFPNINTRLAGELRSMGTTISTSTAKLSPQVGVSNIFKGAHRCTQTRDFTKKWMLKQASFEAISR